MLSGLISKTFFFPGFFLWSQPLNMAFVQQVKPISPIRLKEELKKKNLYKGIMYLERNLTSENFDIEDFVMEKNLEAHGCQSNVTLCTCCHLSF